MRLALALCATLACAQAAAAQTVEDRYGPPRPRAHAAAGQQVASLTPYGGRLLNWSSKGSAPAPVEPAAAPQPEPARAPIARPQPAPIAAAPVPAPQAQHAAPSVAVSAAPTAAPRPQPVAPPPVARRVDLDTPPPAAPRAPQPVAAAPRLPDSLYAPSPPEAAPPPQRMAASAPPPAAAAAGGSRTHYYSVHREYGLAPDAIPAPSQANRYVLIGPPDGTAEDRRKDDDAEDRPF